MEPVFFYAMPHQNDLNTLQNAARLLVDRVFRYKQWTPASRVPLKVHFGEHGNHTFIPASYYDGIIDWLEAQHAETAFIESNVLYGGHRTTRKAHTELAHRHGFTRVPVWIADGEAGEDMADIDINGRYFKTCHVGRLIAEQEQIVVCSHFKGHLMAGFGGALKQLGMGCAARRGKLDQHMGVKPFINPLQCKQCGACLKKCAEDAIHIGRWSRIDRNKCVGCLGCMAVCPSNAVMINWLRSLDKGFSERIAEYALAAQQGKRNVYVTFAFNITRQCDCVGQRMKPIVPDLGILASADPVALDRASLDLLDKRAGRRVFGRGRHILAYAESLGVGEREYELEEIKIN